MQKKDIYKKPLAGCQKILISKIWAPLLFRYPASGAGTPSCIELPGSIKGVVFSN